MVFCATPPYDGLLNNYYKHPADYCFKLPDHLIMEEGALLEPLSYGVAAFQRSDVRLASEVLIMGGGLIGLATLIVGETIGASKVTVIDKKQDRLDIANSYGAQNVELNNNCNTAEAVQEHMGYTPDKVIDCACSSD
uniref:AlaDh_PNT_C domain-containing protein n=1 Tax=Glossina brevipalpis TaxID=37001 RepID=A0A1A9W1L1_9MUSC